MSPNQFVYMCMVKYTLANMVANARRAVCGVYVLRAPAELFADSGVAL